MAVCEYVIDGSDRLHTFNSGWNSFAIENNAGELVEENITGMSIWDFIFGPEVTSVYQHLIKQARMKDISIEFHYRCDSPGEIRHMKMELSPEQNQFITFISSMVDVHKRPYLPLLDSTRPRTNSCIDVCAWCLKVRHKNAWIEMEEAVGEMSLYQSVAMPLLSHMICDSCYQTIQDTIM